MTTETPIVDPHAPVVVPNNNHKNPPVGPTSNKPLPEWRRDRDYEQFMPTPNM